jgi:hypothetical protein
MLYAAPRFSPVVRLRLLEAMRRQCAGAEARGHGAAVTEVVARLRDLGGADHLSAAYHFERGSLTRWAAEALGRQSLPAAVTVVDAAVCRRLAELNEA